MEKSLLPAVNELMFSLMVMSWIGARRTPRVIGVRIFPIPFLLLLFPSLEKPLQLWIIGNCFKNCPQENSVNADSLLGDPSAMK
eukprot:10306789-Karenia_brevis.AAC.1